MKVHAALRDTIAAIPNLLRSTVHEKFATAAHTVVHTQPEVADRIAAVLPDALAQHHCLLVDLPLVTVDEFGDYCVHVPVSSRAWVYVEVRATRAGSVVIRGLPGELAAGDGRAVAAALFAITQERAAQESASRHRQHPAQRHT